MVIFFLWAEADRGRGGEPRFSICLKGHLAAEVVEFAYLVHFFIIEYMFYFIKRQFVT
jgi:hypothetical protein